jgi:hypothetical protein
MRRRRRTTTQRQRQCIRLKDMSLAVLNTEYPIKFPVTYQNVSGARQSHNSLLKISMGKCLLHKWMEKL